MKQWGGRFEKAASTSAEAFGASLPFDVRLYPEDILGSVHHIVFAQPIGGQRAPDDGIDQGRGRNNERIPRSLAARRECPQVDLVQFRHACVSVLRPSAQQFIRVCGEIRPRYSRSALQTEEC